jgi:hypothetical protein
MVTSRHRAFRPSLDGFRLEDRLVLSAVDLAQVGTITAAAVDPLVPTNHGKLKAGYVQATATQFHSAFQTFINQMNRAAAMAVAGQGNGGNEATLLAGLKSAAALQGGNLEAKLQQISSRLPGGLQYLFNPPQGTVPGGYPTNGTSGPDLRYYVHPQQRLKTQVETMLATLNANATTLQNAVGSNSSLTIIQTFQNSKAALVQYINFATANGDFTISHG